MLRDCPIDHRCMTAITPQEIFERARILLEAKGMHHEPGLLPSSRTPLAEAIDKLKFAGLVK
jgi:hypothetical protein